MASVPTIEYPVDIPAASCAFAARELKYEDGAVCDEVKRELKGQCAIWVDWHQHEVGHI